MSKENSNNIAMVGMYGGMWREYNPGCFMIGHKTKLELQRRIPDSSIDIYSIDNRTHHEELEQETVCGLDINFFGREQQIQLLNGTLPKYDAVVLGGDIIWGGDDVVPDNDIFFLNSPQFLASNSPIVLFNCVHTFYDDVSIEEQRGKFERAVGRAAYTSVRTEAIQQRLKNLGLVGVEYIPDPVLDVDMNDFDKERHFLPVERDKPILGISVREKLSDDLLAAMQQVALDDFEVVVFPFSRQYKNLEAVQRVKNQFRNRFRYFEQYLDPVQSYQFIGELDMLLNDTYHGIIGAILHGKPFISLDVEAEPTSRKQQLLQTIGVEDRYNLRLAYDDPNNVITLSDSIPELMSKPVIYVPETMKNVRLSIQKHYDRMAQHIMQIR